MLNKKIRVTKERDWFTYGIFTLTRFNNIKIPLNSVSRCETDLMHYSMMEYTRIIIPTYTIGSPIVSFGFLTFTKQANVLNFQELTEGNEENSFSSCILVYIAQHSREEKYVVIFGQLCRICRHLDRF